MTLLEILTGLSACMGENCKECPLKDVPMGSIPCWDKLLAEARAELTHLMDLFWEMRDAPTAAWRPGAVPPPFDPEEEAHWTDEGTAFTAHRSRPVVAYVPDEGFWIVNWVKMDDEDKGWWVGRNGDFEAEAVLFWAPIFPLPEEEGKE